MSATVREPEETRHGPRRKPQMVRSSRLNTELGLVIDSPAVAGAIADAIDGRLAARAYQVRLTDTGTLQWVDQVGGKQVVHDVEPGTTLWQRFGVSLMSLLPLEWLL